MRTYQTPPHTWNKYGFFRSTEGQFYYYSIYLGPNFEHILPLSSLFFSSLPSKLQTFLSLVGRSVLAQVQDKRGGQQILLLPSRHQTDSVETPGRSTVEISWRERRSGEFKETGGQTRNNTGDRCDRRQFVEARRWRRTRTGTMRKQILLLLLHMGTTNFERYVSPCDVERDPRATETRHSNLQGPQKEGGGEKTL